MAHEGIQKVEERTGMKEYVSDCCGAGYREEKSHAGFDEHGTQFFYCKLFCTRCDKPCKPIPKKEGKDNIHNNINKKKMCRHDRCLAKKG